MNDTNPIQPPIAASVLSAPAKRKRAKSSTPRAARTLDPGIAELRKQHNAAVVALKDKRRSSALLKTILKRIVQLTQDDKNTLLDSLKQIATPALPMEVPNGE